MVNVKVKEYKSGYIYSNNILEAFGKDLIDFFLKRKNGNFNEYNTVQEFLNDVFNSDKQLYQYILDEELIKDINKEFRMLRRGNRIGFSEKLMSRIKKLFYIDIGYINEDGNYWFPAGLSHYVILPLLSLNKNVKLDVEFSKKKYKEVSFDTNISLKDYQEKVVNRFFTKGKDKGIKFGIEFIKKIINQENSIGGKLVREYISKNNTDINKEETDLKYGLKSGFIVSPARSGKTVMMIEIIKNLGKKTLILVNKDFLAQQFLDRFRQFSDIEDISVFSGIDSILNNKDGSDVSISMIQTLYSGLKAGGEKADAVKHFLSQFEYVFIDEGHNVATDSYINVIREIGTTNIFGFTATYKRSDGNIFLLSYYIGPVFEEIKQNEVGLVKDITIQPVLFEWDYIEMFKHYPKSKGKLPSIGNVVQLFEQAQQRDYQLFKSNYYGYKISGLTEDKQYNFINMIHKSLDQMKSLHNYSYGKQKFVELMKTIFSKVILTNKEALRLVGIEDDILLEFLLNSVVNKIFLLLYYNNVLDFNEMYEFLNNNEKRNNKIVDMLVESINDGNLVIFLSKRISHLEIVLDKLKERTGRENVGYIVNGSIKGEKRSKIFEVYNESFKELKEKGKTGKPQVLFATYSLLKEGFDGPVFNQLYLGMPISGSKKDTNDNTATLIQAVNRIGNNIPGKGECVCYDIVDYVPNVIIENEYFYLKNNGKQLDVMYNMFMSRYKNVYVLKNNNFKTEKINYQIIKTLKQYGFNNELFSKEKVKEELKYYYMNYLDKIDLLEEIKNEKINNKIDWLKEELFG